MRDPAAGEEFRDRASRLPPEVLRPLTELSPVRSTLSLLQTAGLAAGFVALGVLAPHPALLVACILGVAVQQHALAILAHQAAHYRLYRTRWLNDLAGRLCAWPLGISMLTYRRIHRLHHNYLYTDVDPDLALMAGYPRGARYLGRKLLKDLAGFTTVKNYRYFFGAPPVAEAVSRLDDTSPELRAAALRDRRMASAFQAAVLVAAIATGAWPYLLLLWVLPLVTVLQAILRLRAVCEHGAVPDTTDPLRAARTNLCPWWIRAVLFPHNMHHHVEHHLYPAVPHYRLPALHRALAARGLLEGAEVSPSLGATLARVTETPA